MPTTNATPTTPQTRTTSPEATALAPAEPPPSLLAVTPAATADSPASGAAGAAGRFLAPPPPPDPSFAPPPGFVPDNAMDFRGVLPRTSELVAMPAAVNDLKAFTDYAEVMGSKVPSWAQMTAAFEITNQWSSARKQAAAWDAFARTQEGIAWTMLRGLMAQMAPVFAFAVASDPTMASALPGLTTVLGAKKTISRKAASTRKANATAKAEGREPTHGKVGKRATKAAAKAALTHQLAAASASTTADASTAAPAQSPAEPTPR